MILINVLMFDSLTTEDERKKGTRERAVFVQLQDDLAQHLQGSITSVAAAAFSRGLITSEARDIVVDATASHDKVQIIKVLTEIHKRIVAEPEKLRVFIDKVMKGIGAPVQHLTDLLGEHSFYIYHQTNFQNGSFLYRKRPGECTNCNGH